MAKLELSHITKRSVYFSELPGNGGGWEGRRASIIEFPFPFFFFQEGRNDGGNTLRFCWALDSGLKFEVRQIF